MRLVAIGDEREVFGRNAAVKLLLAKESECQRQTKQQELAFRSGRSSSFSDTSGLRAWSQKFNLAARALFAWTFRLKTKRLAGSSRRCTTHQRSMQSPRPRKPRAA